MTDYGETEIKGIDIECPRCACVVPVFVRSFKDQFDNRREVHCLKCRYDKHKGTLIMDFKELPNKIKHRWAIENGERFLETYYMLRSALKLP